MSFSEDYHRVNAVHTALEWMLLRLVKTSPNPQSVLDDFRKHMDQSKKELEAFGMDMIREGKVDTFSNVTDGASALEDLKNSMLDSVKVG